MTEDIRALLAELNEHPGEAPIEMRCAQALRTLLAERERDRQEIERLKRAVNNAFGWREKDWPEGFCRRSAQLVADHVEAALSEWPGHGDKR